MPRSTRAILAGAGACAALVAYTLLHYPHVFARGRGEAVAVLAAFALVAAAYAILALSARVRPDPAARRAATACGLAAGAMWMVEMAGGDLLPRSEGWLGPFGELGAVAFTALAGAWGARRARAARAGAVAGLWSGLVSGVMACAAIVAGSELFASVLAARPDYVRELARSGEPDMTTFIVKDAVFAGMSHLYIGLLLGLVAGGVAGAIAEARLQREVGGVDEAVA